MNEQPDFNTWQGIQTEVLDRIRNRIWKPGDPIPNEADLAKEFGCARTTVNRALRQLAEDGILERKRRSGTRVALHPVAKTVIDIQILRQEIEEKGGVYSYRLLASHVETPPMNVSFALSLKEDADTLYLRAVHLKDGMPYALEDRWICLAAVPDAEDIDFATHSANEWLLQHVPYTTAHLSILSVPSGELQNKFLDAPVGTPLLQLDRATWNGAQPVTFVSLWYHPNYRIMSKM